MTTLKTARRVALRGWKTYALLVAMGVVPCGIAFLSNPFGPFIAAYLGTALVWFGVFELARRLRRRQPVGIVWGVLGVGVLDGIVMNASTVLGTGTYWAFLIGQGITVGVVVWLFHLTRK